jgi:hypothetical protein
MNGEHHFAFLFFISVLFGAHKISTLVMTCISTLSDTKKNLFCVTAGEINDLVQRTILERRWQR